MWTCYRDAMSVDSLDPCGVYFGTTGGQVYASADAGDSWSAAVRDLPGGPFGRGPDPAVSAGIDHGSQAAVPVPGAQLAHPPSRVRVRLPAQLRDLARLPAEVVVEVAGR